VRRARAGAALAGALALAALGACGGEPTRTVTVRQGPPAPTSTQTEVGAGQLPLRDSARIARARVALAEYCDAKTAGRNPPADSEVAALAVLLTLFAQNPSARFSTEGSSLAMAEVLKFEATALDENECDPKSAILLRNMVDAVTYKRDP
jgi:hypothetical protein